MSKLVWDKLEERLYEAGTRQGALYPIQDDGTYSKGVAWNGLTAVTESPSGAEPTELWADDINYLNLTSAEKFGATVEAYTYPDEFAECDGTAEIAPGVFAGQQVRKMFGLAYRTVLGNAVAGEDYGYKLHLVYGAKASPSEKSYSTINDSPDAVTFSWDLCFDSTKTDPEKLKALEEIVYGKDETSKEAGDGIEPRLPLPDEVIALMAAV